jgi:gamma-glutamylcyclotransferase (GGCT)/AIG2-like uncharacterized protein YtfP
MSADTRLASYGTLAPGRENHAQVEQLNGHWVEGIVRGRAATNTKGRWVGYPGFVLDPDGEDIPVFILQSDDLPAHWHHLDAFEGEAYRRVTATAQTANGPVDVSIYELKQPD